MSLTQALATASAGLRATQAGLSLVAANVANAETPGYVRKTPVAGHHRCRRASASASASTAINRELDQYVQRQLRVETAGGAYAGLRAQFYKRAAAASTASRAPSSALETMFNNFTTALQALATSPESISARSAVLSVRRRCWRSSSTA